MWIITPVLSVIALLAEAPCGSRVLSRDGRILIEDSSGAVSTLVATGRDFQPWITWDCRDAVFVRAAPEDDFRTSVYIIDVKSAAERLLFKGPVKYLGRENAYLGEPKLDETQHRLFLISEEGVTAGALLTVDLASGAVRYVTDSVGDYDLIRCGPHRGDLLVRKREYALSGEIYYLCWLFSPDGKDLGVAGPGSMDRKPLLDPDCTVMRSEEADAAKASRELAAQARRQGAVPLQIESKVMERNLLVRVEPEYPAPARAANIQGTVRLQVIVAPDGNVSMVRLISGPPELASAALQAVKKWKYRPTVSNGVAVEVVTNVDLRFSLAK